MAVTYKCVACKKKFEVRDKIQCPYCGYRIVVKPRIKKPKVVIAR
jgi:DNA-directed RNA polymerase subunit RPC12/RpoP